MRIIVFSDSHGSFRNVKKMLESTASTTDAYIFLGDGESDVKFAREAYPDKLFLCVSGNCDFGSSEQKVGVFEAAGKKIIYTHGHFQHVGFGMSYLENLAKDNAADVVLYGHTHVRSCEYKDGVYYINPGSIGKPRDAKPPSYAALDIIPAGILCTHCDVEEGF